MTKEFIELMKSVGERYGITIKENAPKGGIFYRNELGEMEEVPYSQCCHIMTDFYMSVEHPLNENETVFELNDMLNIAA